MSAVGGVGASVVPLSPPAAAHSEKFKRVWPHLTSAAPGGPYTLLLPRRTDAARPGPGVQPSPRLRYRSVAAARTHVLPTKPSAKKPAGEGSGTAGATRAHVGWYTTGKAKRLKEDVFEWPSKFDLWPP